MTQTTKVDSYSADEPYWNLAKAVVMQAAEDYMIKARAVAVMPDNEGAISEMESIGRFFARGAWGLLEDIDTDWFCKRLRERAVCSKKKKFGYKETGAKGGKTK